MRIDGYTKQTKQNPHKGWSRPEIKIGTTVFLIKYLGYDGYFTYGYQSYQEAQNVITTMIEQQTDNNQFYPWNVVEDPESAIIK